MDKLKKRIIKEVHHYDKTEFPVTLYCFDENSNIPIPMHIHEEIEIIYFKEGNAIYEIDFSDYIVNSETIIIINKNTPHGVKDIKVGNSKGHVFIFSPNMLEGAIDDFCTSKYITPLIEKKMDFLCLINRNENFQLFDILKDILLEIYDINKEQNYAYELRIKAKLIEFFSFLFQYNYAEIKNLSEKELNKRKKMEKVFSYIHENYRNEISFEKAAEIFALSEIYFGRIFKEYTGFKFTDYLNLYRTNQAAKLLINTENSITEICYNTGFSNFSYFIKTFKKNYKDTPSSYRKKHQKSTN